jgi:hypothetical protein
MSLIEISLLAELERRARDRAGLALDSTIRLSCAPRLSAAGLLRIEPGEPQRLVRPRKGDTHG